MSCSSTRAVSILHYTCDLIDLDGVFLSAPPALAAPPPGSGPSFAGQVNQGRRALMLINKYQMIASTRFNDCKATLDISPHFNEWKKKKKLQESFSYVTCNKVCSDHLGIDNVGMLTWTVIYWLLYRLVATWSQCFRFFQSFECLILSLMLNRFV